MSEALLSSIVVAAGSIICQLLINNRSRKEKQTEDAVKDAKLDARLSSIEEKLDTHNGYAEKIGSLVTDVAIIKTEIKNMKED